MKVLYISERENGGIRSHVRNLRQNLPEGISHYTIGEDEIFEGSSGHDIRDWFQIRRVIKTFKPDVIHFHMLHFFMCLYVKLFVRVPCIVSLHMPFSQKPSLRVRLLYWLLSPTYFLPVSNATWNGFRRWFKSAKGEVFFNSVEVKDSGLENGCLSSKNRPSFVVGLVGRFDVEKDWGAFAQVTGIVKQRRANIEVWGVGVDESEAKNSLGRVADHIECKGYQKNGKSWIEKMDIFILTSRHEELPTVVLEAFASRTAICGYIPEGGMAEILAFSNGALREVFIEERNPESLADIVCRLLDDEELRKRVIDDGLQIVRKHFDAAKNIKRLVDVYGELGCNFNA
jgi:glycosyltransferase involved in cell wall biosynthesis